MSTEDLQPKSSANDSPVTTLPAANAWMMAHEHHQDETAVCDGVELLRW